MSLIEFHRFSDGTPLQLRKASVSLVENNRSGVGTTIWLQVGDRAVEIHVTENYEQVVEELGMSEFDRAARDFLNEADEADGKGKVPF